MAKILANPWGPLRGRVGNNVFSRNKAGQIIRSYVKPVNPNTPAQLRARAGFSQAVSGFQSITARQRTLWQEYANNYFKPKLNKGGVSYSGFNAYVSLKNAVENALVLPRTYDLTVDGTSRTADVTFLSFGFNIGDPPNAGFSTVFQGSTGADFYSANLQNVVVDANAAVEFELKFRDGGVTLKENFDANNNTIGYAPFLSNGNPAANMSYKKPMQYSLGYFSPWDPEGTFGPDFNAETILVETNDSFDIGLYSDFPLVGEYCIFTLYFISRTGQFARLASTEIQIT